MDIHAELAEAEGVARRAVTWCAEHAEHLAAIAEAAASGPVGQALEAAAGVLLPEDEKLIAEFTALLASVRRRDMPQDGAVQAAGAPAPVTEGEGTGTSSDGAQGGAQGAAGATAADAAVTA